MTDRQRRNSLASAGALSGGSAGALLSGSPFVRNQLVRAATRPGSRYRIYGSSLMAPDLYNGSGEAMMTSRLAKLYQKHGIGMSYVPGNLDPMSYSHVFPKGLSEYSEPLHGSGLEQLRQLMSSSAWNKRVVPFINETGVREEKVVRGLSDVLSKNPKLRKKFIADVISGKFTGMQPGRLRDFGVLDASLLSQPELIANMNLPSNPQIEINAFRGFDPIDARGWTARNGLRHEQNLMDSVTPEGRKNLGTLMGFEANMTENSERLIPGVNIPSSVLDRNPLTARLRHNRDRKSLINFISGVQDKVSANDLKGKKIVFVSSGSVGPNTSQRLRDVVSAAARHPDVHVLFQTGTNKYAPDMANVISELQNKYPGVLTPVGRVDASKMNKFINGADVYIPYGGSSTASEAGAHFTPSVFATDGDLNQGNIDAIKKFRNHGGKVRVDSFDNVTTAFATELENFKKSNGRLPTAEEIDRMISSLATERRVGYLANEGARSKAIFESLINDPEFLTRTVASNNAKFDKALEDAKNGTRYSKDTIDSVKRYIRNASDSNKNAIRTARDTVLSAIDSDDRKLMSDTKNAVKNIFTGKNGSRVESLKKLFSGRGLKGIAFNMSNPIFKTPMGRRFGLPLAAVGALGVGGTAYAALKPKPKDFGDKIMDVFRNFGRKR